MEILTENEGLKELLEKGSSKKKDLRDLPKSTIKGFFKAIAIMKSAKRIEDLYPYKSLNYEKLKGALKYFESVRCDKRYRLIFKSSIQENSEDAAEEGDTQQTIITNIDLIKISDHYGDL